MFLAGTNFALHYRVLRGDFKAYFRDTEFKFYCIVIAVSITLISWNTIRFQVNGDIPYDSMWTSLRYATFQVMAIITTTGYGTADYEQWPALSQFILITLMFYGGCAGSTGGGMKQVRFLLLIKQSGAEIKRLIFPSRCAAYSCQRPSCSARSDDECPRLLFLFHRNFCDCNLHYGNFRTRPCQCCGGNNCYDGQHRSGAGQRRSG